MSGGGSAAAMTWISEWLIVFFSLYSYLHVPSEPPEGLFFFLCENTGLGSGGRGGRWGG